MNMVTFPISTIEKVERKLEKVLREVRDLKRGQTKKTAKPVKFWSKKQWQDAERETDEDIKNGRLLGPFQNVDDLIKELHKGAGAY